MGMLSEMDLPPLDVSNSMVSKDSKTGHQRRLRYCIRVCDISVRNVLLLRYIFQSNMHGQKIIALFFFLQHENSKPQRRNAGEGNPARIFFLAVSDTACSGYLENLPLLTLCCMAPSKIANLTFENPPQPHNDKQISGHI